ncbi:MAG: hypothetical protein U1E92_04250 [Moraxella osloensis]
MNQILPESFINRAAQNVEYACWSSNEWLAGNQFSGADMQLEFGINAMQETRSLDAKYATFTIS